MNQPALDALARPVVLNPVEDLPPFVQSLKDQAAAKGETDIDQYFMGDNRKLTVQELQAREDEKAFMLGNIDYAQQTLPTPEEQLRNGAYAMPNGGAVGGQQPGQPNQGQTPTAAQAQFTQSPETLKAQQELAQAQSQSPQMRQVERQPVSQRDAIVSTILATLFPQQSTGILQAPGAQAERQYQEESQKAQNQFALDDRSHKQRLDVLKALLESAMEGDQRRFESDKFNTGERNDMTVQTRGQDLMLQRAQEGNDSREKIAGDKLASQDKIAIFRQLVSKNPEVRRSAATALKARHGIDAYDPDLMAKLTPDEQAALQRAKRIEAMTPIEVELGKVKIKLSETQREWVQTKIDHYPEYLEALAQRSAQGWARQAAAEENDNIKRTADSFKARHTAVKDQYNLKTNELNELDQKRSSLGPHEIVGRAILDTLIEKVTQQRNELGSQLYELAEEAKSRTEGFAPVDPMTVDPSLRGKISNPHSRSARKAAQSKSRLKAQMGPFADSV